METTKVIFRVWNTKPYDVIALFPELPADEYGYNCVSYEHVGQHGAAGYEHVIAHSRPPRTWGDMELVADISRELEGLGYNLEVMTRCTPAMRKERRRNADKRSEA